MVTRIHIRDLRPYHSIRLSWSKVKVYRICIYFHCKTFLYDILKQKHFKTCAVLLIGFQAFLLFFSFFTLFFLGLISPTQPNETKQRMCNFFVSGTCSARESLLRYSNFVNVTYNSTFVFNSTSPITSVPRFSEYDGICVRSLNITLTQRPRNRKLENICKVCTRQILSFP